MLSEGHRRQLHVLLLVVLDAFTIATAFSFAYNLRFYSNIIPVLNEPSVAS